MSYGGVGIANATNTNTDTSARVHTTARLCLNIYNSLGDPNVIKNHKEEYSAIKEEIALGIGRPFCSLGVAYGEQKGLTPVITNTAIINSGKLDDLMKWYVKFYDCRSISERVFHCKTPCQVKGQAYFPSEMYFAGFVMSEAVADPSHGDNALTLMIGGKITVMNGKYPIENGEKVQWYFEEEAEAGCFRDDDGSRIERAVSSTRPIQYLNPTSKQMVKIRDHQYAERAGLKRPALIKACKRGIDGTHCTIGDEGRVFGSACGKAGPYERVDIKVGRQSL
jgi:hypothetical protein